MIVNVYKYDGTVYEIDAPELVVPEPEPIPEPENEDDVWAELDKAYQEGVNTAYDQ